MPPKQPFCRPLLAEYTAFRPWVIIITITAAGIRTRVCVRGRECITPAASKSTLWGRRFTEATI